MASNLNRICDLYTIVDNYLLGGDYGECIHNCT